MASILPGYEYDIFISYRQKDNKGEHWVTEFVSALKAELEATFKEDISIYFDENPHDGLLETHVVDKSLEGKLRCLIFIPILSQTYCDPKSFAWTHEFCAFNKLATTDQIGRDIKLTSGNVTSRILPVKIHDLDIEDKTLVEKEIGGVVRAVEFIYKEPGVNRPLKPADSKNDNQNKTDYRNQVNKIANAIKEIVSSIKSPDALLRKAQISSLPRNGLKRNGWRRRLVIAAVMAVLVTIVVTSYMNWQGGETDTDHTIAVLPFKLIGNDEEGRYFADGVSDALISNLQVIRDLKVRPAASLEKYADSGMSAAEIGNELNVKYVLEGSAQKYKDDIRIIVHLVNASTDEYVWIKEYNEKFANIFKIQSEIALNISSELNIRLANSQRLRVEKIPTTSTEAWDYYLRGKTYNKNYWKDGNAQDAAIASDFYRKAIQADPEFALPYLRLGDTGAELLSSDSVLSLINKGIQLDPESPDGYEILGIRYVFQGQPDKGIPYIEKALQMDSLENFLLSLGRAYAMKSDDMMALSCFAKALKREKTEYHQWVLYETARSYAAVGELELAGQFCDAALEFEPDNLQFLRVKLWIQWYRGNYDQCIQIADQYKGIAKENYAAIGWIFFLNGQREKSEQVFRERFSAERSYLTMEYDKVSFAYVLMQLGKQKEADSIMKDVMGQVDEFWSHDLVRARVYGARGNELKAVEHLRKWRPQWGLQILVGSDPMFDAIKEGPEFVKVLKGFQQGIDSLRKEAKIRRERGEFPSLPESLAN